MEKRTTLWGVGVLVLLLVGVLASCDFMGQKADDLKGSPAPGTPTVIEEHNGPFSALRNKYADRAIAYELSKSGASRDIAPDTTNMTLGEKVDFLNSLRNSSSRDVNATDPTEDDAFYQELSSQMLTETEGVVLISTNPIEIPEELAPDFKSPSIQEVNGTGYSTLEILAMAERAADPESSPDGSRGLTRVSTPKWGSEIKYRFETTVNDTAKKNIRAAMDEWQTAANNKFKFTEIENNGWNQFIWTIGDNHLRIYTDSSDPNIAGAATLGKGAWRIFNIVSGDSMRTTRHELGHVLGLEHEQCRYDRDNYVTVYYNNIKDYDAWWNRGYYRDQFNKIELGHDVYLYISIRVLWWSYSTRVKIGYVENSRVYAPFDYDSVMIYSSYAFSKNNKPDVMLRKNGGLIYTNSEISAGDKTAIRAMYP